MALSVLIVEDDVALSGLLEWHLKSEGYDVRVTPDGEEALLMVREARLGLMAAVIAGFGRVISEVGASMMVGGNIKGETRVLTTATVMEVGKGNYDLAIAISLVLLLGAFSVVVLLTWLQHGGRKLQL